MTPLEQSYKICKIKWGYLLSLKYDTVPVVAYLSYWLHNISIRLLFSAKFQMRSLVLPALLPSLMIFGGLIGPLKSKIPRHHAFAPMHTLPRDHASPLYTHPVQALKEAWMEMPPNVLAPHLWPPSSSISIFPCIICNHIRKKFLTSSIYGPVYLQGISCVHSYSSYLH